jgi:transcriptional regulator with GAF, ATPase, and Fis domain
MYISISWSPSTSMLHMRDPNGKQLVRNYCRDLVTVLEVIKALTGKDLQPQRSICPSTYLYHLPVEVPAANKKYSDAIITHALRQADGNGMKASELLGCTFPTVYSRAKKLGLKLDGMKNRRPRNDKKFSDEEICTALENNGNSSRRAAKHLGAAHNTIRSRAKKLGIPLAGKKGRPRNQ